MMTSRAAAETLKQALLLPSVAPVTSVTAASIISVFESFFVAVAAADDLRVATENLSRLCPENNPGLSGPPADCAAPAAPNSSHLQLRLLLPT